MTESRSPAPSKPPTTWTWSLTRAAIRTNLLMLIGEITGFMPGCRVWLPPWCNTFLGGVAGATAAAIYNYRHGMPHAWQLTVIAGTVAGVLVTRFINWAIGPEHVHCDYCDRCSVTDGVPVHRRVKPMRRALRRASWITNSDVDVCPIGDCLFQYAADYESDLDADDYPPVEALDEDAYVAVFDEGAHAAGPADDNGPWTTPPFFGHVFDDDEGVVVSTWPGAAETMGMPVAVRDDGSIVTWNPVTEIPLYPRRPDATDDPRPGGKTNGTREWKP